MHVALSLLLASTVFMHALFGCCWHHAHDCDQHEAGVVQKETPCCCPHHACEQQPAPPPAEPCHQDCKGVCTYIPPQKTQIDSLLTRATLDILCEPSMLARCDLAVSAWEQCHGALQPRPPSRLHLLHQVFLI